MPIQAYLVQTRTSIDRYAATSFVIDAETSFEIRPGDQGYLGGSITFVDGTILYFREFLDATGEAVAKLMYTYHYQDAGNQLIFRYDNARHRPLLRSLTHSRPILGDTHTITKKPEFFKNPGFYRSRETRTYFFFIAF